ncbi:EAL domain-containing protein [Rhodoplanes sp. Z2-YC6860]|uniref:EAL domain-containing protein n=1 Tax=Rhodoplanes sp. Z2-YC6860 TaxID=674703 RepID=UPI00078D27F5|nr:EAL domain-containing protein [Rhodoplanes sp. Z2-YC6860]AMN40017.1 diguanylate phosphodiesterase [Rhodoplanes sp. Z2-YC6860]
MLRLGAIFVVFCMVLIAASAGAVLYLLVGLRAQESMIVAISILTGLAIYNATNNRLRDRANLAAQIADLSRGCADLARQVAEVGRRTAALEGQGDQIAGVARNQARLAAESVTSELGELSTLVKQLAETVAVHELKFVSGQQQAAAEAALEAIQPQPADEAAPEVPSFDAPNIAAAARANMIETMRNALDGNRVDLYLQPTVTLPQRKVRFYESFARLRTENGTIVMPSDFMTAAEASGLIAKLDQQMLFRAVQVIRRLQIKNREVGLFCNISPTTLNDPMVFPELLQFMDANRAIAPSLILEFRQSVLRSMGPLETESLASLRDLGFRFSMDAVTDLRMEPRDLGERGIRYVKVPSQFLLGDGGSSGSDIHAADLSDLLGRFGISLIAEKIEAEAQVVDLLEYDVRFGQGYLFSQPRPVRNEALRGAGETDIVLDDAADRPRRAVGGTGFTL